MSLAHAILGFLSHTPMSGYDLRKHMDQSVAHFWPADQAQIYRTLARLVDDELVTVDDVEQDGRPTRRVHHILPAGVRELERWLSDPVPWEPDRDAFLLQLFFVGRLGGDAVRHLLDQRAVEANQLHDVLEAIRVQAEEALGAQPWPLDVHLRMATLANGQAHALAELAWLDELSDQLGARP